ncbi:MAG: glycosyltransferase [Alphaproteobacteria bacterium]|nr:glycosyltransferase [Alphaproteobacteria bacterium]
MGRRLLQAIAGAPYGGAETFFVRLVSALQRAGEDQQVLIRRDPNRSRRLREAGLQVTELGFRNRLDLSTHLAFRREVTRWKPSIVLTWMSRATQLCPAGDFRHVARLGGYYDLKYYRRCDHLIGNTRAIAAYAVAHGWPAERVHYLPNFVPDLSAATAVDRATVETPEGAPIAIALGRLHPNKGFDLLLEALARVPRLYLWIVGTGPLRRSMERRAASLGVSGRVRFLGWRDDVSGLLATADFLVLSSRREPFGNVVIEAWSASKPVVAVASDGPRELIDNGENGLLVPIDVVSLAEAMTALADDAAQRARLAAGGRRTYEANFTEDLVVSRYRHFFDGLSV